MIIEDAIEEIKRLKNEVSDIKASAAIRAMIELYDLLNVMSEKELEVFRRDNSGPIDSILEFLDPD